MKTESCISIEIFVSVLQMPHLSANSIYSFVISLSHLAKCPQGLCVLSNVELFPSFSR